MLYKALLLIPYRFYFGDIKSILNLLPFSIILILFLPSLSLAETLSTKGFDITITVNCEEGNVSCDDVDYQGVSKKSGKALDLKGRTWHSMCKDNKTPCQFRGYVFMKGKTQYTVHENGLLEVTNRHGKVLVKQQGTWSKDAASGCVYDASGFSESRYKANIIIATYSWNQAEKSVKGITAQGDLFSAEHFGCSSYGTSAIMLSKASFEPSSAFVRKKLELLADLVFDPAVAKGFKHKLSMKKLRGDLAKGVEIEFLEEISGYQLSYALKNQYLIVEVSYYIH